MNSPLVVGLDCGTSVIKAAAFDLEGKEVAVGHGRIEFLSPSAGRMEFEPDALWSAVCHALGSLRESLGVVASNIAALGLTGAGNGLTLTDAHGKAIGRGILAVDNRAADLGEPWPGFDDQARAIHGQGRWAGQTITLLRWMAANEPERLASAERIFIIKDYVKHRLTGAYVSDVSELSKTGLLDLDSCTASARLYDHYGLGPARSKLPRVGESWEVVGTVSSAAAESTGLRTGVPVVNGLADIDASALGSGAVSAGEMSIVAGTWSINQYFTAAPARRNDIFGTSRHAVPGVWEQLEASASSTANLTWFVREACSDLARDAALSGESVYDAVNRIVATVPPATTPVVFHPYLYGSNTIPSARAGFYGIAGWQDRRHVLAALFEGVVFSHAVHVKRLLADGQRPTIVRLSGGAARSHLWSQMFADVLGVPLTVSGVREVGALGAAMCAAVGVGAVRDFPEAAARMANPPARLEPNESLHIRYRERFAAFEEITALMKPVWETLHSSFGSNTEAPSP